jgi:hypothetical protein
MSKLKRTYPENRNPETRLASRRAYYQRNKVRINEQMRAKKGKVADWWAGVLARIEIIASKQS